MFWTETKRRVPKLVLLHRKNTGGVTRLRALTIGCVADHTMPNAAATPKGYGANIDLGDLFLEYSA